MKTGRPVTRVIAPPPDPNKIYWRGPMHRTDHFGIPYRNTMIEGRTKMGPWANMTEESWRHFGVGQLGDNLGQKYQRQTDGRWLKIEG
jgi:hypothetical protein